MISLRICARAPRTRTLDVSLRTMSKLRSSLVLLSLSACVACAGDKVPSKGGSGSAGESDATGGSEASTGGTGGTSDTSGGISSSGGSEETGGSTAGGTENTGGKAATGGKGGAVATGGASGGSAKGGATATGGSSGAASTGGKAATTGGTAGKGGSTGNSGAPSGTCAAAQMGGVSLADGTALTAPVKPNPNVALGKPATSSDGDDTSFLFDDPTDGNFWNASSGDWVKVDVGTGHDRLLLIWLATGYPEYTAPSTSQNFGVPTAYDIDVSADGTTWTNAVRVTASTTGSTPRTREHSFAFTGMRWVRYKVTGIAPGSGNAKISSMQIFDASQGTEDTWLFAGSGPSRGVYALPSLPSLGSIVHGCYPKYYPATISIADLSGKVSYLSEKSPFDAQKTVLDSWIALNPDMKFWVLIYGLEDVKGVAKPPATFATSLQKAITTLVAAGKTPILPRIQFVSSANTSASDYAGIPAFNAVIDQLVATNGLPPAADLYAWYKDHPTLLCAAADAGDPGEFCGESQWNGIQPIDSATRPGVRDAVRLWAAAGDAARAWTP